MSHDDFAIETVPGLPEALPPGENLLWQGKPQWQPLAVRGLHVRKVAVYFLLLAAWTGFEAQVAGQDAAGIAFAAAGQIGLGAIACGLLAGMAWLIARSTIYTITDDRVVIRFGVALQFTINLPFAVVQTAALRQHADGTGDVPIGLAPHQTVSYLLLWPHARAWRVARTEPMLRNISEPQRVAALLAEALQAYQQRHNLRPAANPIAAPDGAVPSIVRRDSLTAAA
jgi:hypothetical protein